MPPEKKKDEKGGKWSMQVVSVCVCVWGGEEVQQGGIDLLPLYRSARQVLSAPPPPLTSPFPL